MPASAEKKVVVAVSDIKTLYDKFKGLSLKDKTTEETAGADVTSFRSVSYTHLSDAVKLQFVIGHDLTKLRDVKGSQSRTAGNQNAFCRLAADVYKRQV